MTERDRELITKGLKYEKQQMGDLIDNAYRAGAITRDQMRDPNFDMSYEELSKLYSDRLIQLGYQT